MIPRDDPENRTADHAADRLLRAIERIGSPVCIGIDPVVDRLPRPLAALDPVEAIERFSIEVIDAVCEAAPCVKVQSACFERFGAAGAAALERVLAHSRRQAGLIVILDAKRGDIGLSAEHYAAGVFDRDLRSAPDFITINSYLGDDGILPFLRPGRGAFALVRTSNPASDRIQTQRLDDGRTVAEAVADVIADIGESTLGESGYSALGAVVGATKRDEIAALRKRMPKQILLVPGYGAQGATADDIRDCFNADGRGALITASRSVIHAFQPAATNWPDMVEAAAKALADEIRGAIA